jgi:hypothetical protein
MSIANQHQSRSDLKIVVFYNGFFGERFIANMMNYSTSCPSFGACGIDGCVQCKENAYSFSKNIVAAFGMINPLAMPRFIENAEDFLPKTIPEADIVVAINLHPDILAALPDKISDRVKALLVPVEEPAWCPPGLSKQLKEKCKDLGIEFASPKPFCILRKSDEHPLINRFIDEMALGYPEFEIELEDRGEVKKIKSIKILRSQPCGAAWFIGIKLRELEFSDMRQLWNVVSEAHHSYPCTGSMEKDNEYAETILHVAGYTARHAVDMAIGYEGDEEIPEHLKTIVIADQKGIPERIIEK